MFLKLWQDSQNQKPSLADLSASFHNQKKLKLLRSLLLLLFFFFVWFWSQHSSESITKILLKNIKKLMQENHPHLSLPKNNSLWSRHQIRTSLLPNHFTSAPLSRNFPRNQTDLITEGRERVRYEVCAVCVSLNTYFSLFIFYYIILYIFIYFICRNLLRRNAELAVFYEF